MLPLTPSQLIKSVYFFSDHQSEAQGPAVRIHGFKSPIFTECSKMFFNPGTRIFNRLIHLIFSQCYHAHLNKNAVLSAGFGILIQQLDEFAPNNIYLIPTESHQPKTRGFDRAKIVMRFSLLNGSVFMTTSTQTIL